MVAYSFQGRFAEPILSGRKRQTIRAIGKRRHAEPGETLQLYQGMRTRGCRLIATAHCSGWCLVTIRFRTGSVEFGDQHGAVAGWLPSGRPTDLDAFARADGFGSWGDLALFWRDVHGVRIFSGRLTAWLPETLAGGEWAARNPGAG